MKIFRVLAAAFALHFALLGACDPVLAQWQVPTNNIPIGQGAGVRGYAYTAPGAAGTALISNGVGSPPSFQAPVSTMLSDSANIGRLNANNAWTGNQAHAGTETFNGATQFNGINNFAGAVGMSGFLSSGPNFLNGPSYFGNGKPWVDVRSGANSCAAAIGNGVADDTVAIQCQITYMNATYTGGIVFLPCGSYLVSGASGLKVYAGVWLVGGGSGIAGTACTTIEVAGNTTDVTFQVSASTATCPSGNHYGGMEKIAVYGYNNSGATSPAVNITAGCNVTIRDTTMFLGSYGLQNDGVDSVIFGGWACGYTGCVLSHGANWYIRLKMDKFAGTPTYGFNQGASSFAAENHFTQVDLTCTCSFSLNINDGGANTALTFFEGSVFDSPISQTSGHVLSITGGEVGSTSFAVNGGVFMMTTTIALGGATTVTGTAARTCAAQSGFTC